MRARRVRERRCRLTCKVWVEGIVFAYCQFLGLKSPDIFSPAETAACNSFFQSRKPALCNTTYSLDCEQNNTDRLAVDGLSGIPPSGLWEAAAGLAIADNSAPESGNITSERRTSLQVAATGCKSNESLAQTMLYGMDRSFETAFSGQAIRDCF
jgi:hypothetical protein